jgi:hypothetical protein
MELVGAFPHFWMAGTLMHTWLPWWLYMVAMVVIHGCHGGYTWLPWWLYMVATVVIHGCHGGSLFILLEFKKYF